jgi:hypothetical protein
MKLTGRMPGSQNRRKVANIGKTGSRQKGVSIGLYYTSFEFLPAQGV